MAWRRITPFLFLLFLFCSCNAQAPYFIIGYVYLNEKPVKGEKITIINMERNESVYTFTDEYGFYYFEVGYSKGWKSGEEITLFVTINGENFSVKDYIRSGTHQWLNITIERESKLKADFYYIPNNPSDIDEINFYDLSVGNIVNYTWDFGDGCFAYEKNPKHRYADDGTYEVKLKVRDENGEEKEIKKEINVRNVEPIPDFYWEPKNPKINEEINFLDNSSDLDGWIVNYTWDFGDGCFAYEKNPKHRYEKEGIYKVSLRVEDNDGAFKEKSENIKISKKETKEDFFFIIMSLIVAVLFLIRNKK